MSKLSGIKDFFVDYGTELVNRKNLPAVLGSAMGCGLVVVVDALSGGAIAPGVAITNFAGMSMGYALAHSQVRTEARMSREVRRPMFRASEINVIALLGLSIASLGSSLYAGQPPLGLRFTLSTLAAYGIGKLESHWRPRTAPECPEHRVVRNPEAPSELRR